MKQLNIWKTSFYTMLAIAAGAFTACVDDDVDKQAPTLELSEEAVAFTGTATEDATVTVRSNRQWTVAYEDEETQKEWMYFKVSGNEVSEGIYNGDGTVKITVGESAQPHMGRLIFTLSNSYGELYRKYLTVTQGNYVPPTVGAVGKLVEYILGNSDLSGAVGSDKAMPLQYSESTIEAVILANDAAGNNNRKLYVGDNNGLERGQQLRRALLGTAGGKRRGRHHPAADQAQPVRGPAVHGAAQAKPAPRGNPFTRHRDHQHRPADQHGHAAAGAKRAGPAGKGRHRGHEPRRRP